MQKMKILIVEDEEDIAEIIKLNLEKEGFRTVIEEDGLNGFLAVGREKPDLILLDIMLPGINGLDFCRKLKSSPELSKIPIIMISAKSEESDIVIGLELGADDYVTKPFSSKVLLSRIKAVTRRGQEGEKPGLKTLAFGEFALDVENYQVQKRGRLIPLTLSEFGILRRLVQNQGKVLTRNQLLDEIHGDDAFVVDRNIDVHIASIRKKLGPSFDWIDTVRGVGYRFKDE